MTRQFGYLQCKLRDSLVRKRELIYAEEKRDRSRPKITWEEVIKKYLKYLYLIKNMTQS